MRDGAITAIAGKKDVNPFDSLEENPTGVFERPNQVIRVRRGTETNDLPLDEKKLYTVGRGSECLIRIEGNDKISRLHGYLTFKAGSWFYEDRGSSNGSFITDIEIVGKRPDDSAILEAMRLSPEQPVRLIPGNMILLASHNYSLELTNAAMFPREYTATENHELDLLPSPLAAFKTLGKAEHESSQKVRVWLVGFEKGLSFFCFLLIAELRARARSRTDEGLAARLDAILGAYPNMITMGKWLELCLKLLPLLPLEADSYTKISKAFLDARGAQTELTGRLRRELVPYRNIQAHAIVPSAAAEAREGEIFSLWSDFCRAFLPIRENWLVSMAKIVSFEHSSDDEQDEHPLIRYKLRLHSGSQDHFPIMDATTADRLSEGWCYLFGRKNRATPLRPFIRCEVSEITQRHELLLACGVVPDEKGRLIYSTLDGVTRKSLKK
ncbi:MAG: FHA domain-containing protein [Pseudomonadota bacterium]